MSSKRAEPFLLALGELRSRLRRGAIPFDRRLAATEIAEELGLSATPVREALSRLAGEGLLEDRRGQGVFVRRLGRGDIADLYRLNLAHLRLALDAAGEPATAVMTDDDAPAADAVEATERLFAGWVRAAGGRALVLSHSRVQAQLGPVRRLEPQLLPDLGEEADALMAAAVDRTRRLATLRRFHRRRVRIAGPLAELLERGVL